MPIENNPLTSNDLVQSGENVVSIDPEQPMVNPGQVMPTTNFMQSPTQKIMTETATALSLLAMATSAVAMLRQLFSKK